MLHLLLELRLSIKSGCEKNYYVAPFLPQSLFTHSRTGKIFFAWSEEFLIEVRDTTGKYLRTLHFPYEKKPLDTEKFFNSNTEATDETIKNWKCIVNKGTIPSSWPSLKHLKTDDKDRLWVATITNDMKNYVWWVLNLEGKLLAKFKWPKKHYIVSIKDGYLYSKEDYSDRSMYVKHRITFKEHK